MSSCPRSSGRTLQSLTPRVGEKKFLMYLIVGWHLKYVNSMNPAMQFREVREFKRWQSWLQLCSQTHFIAVIPLMGSQYQLLEIWAHNPFFEILDPPLRLRCPYSIACRICFVRLYLFLSSFVWRHGYLVNGLALHCNACTIVTLSLIHISEPTRPY